MYRYFLQRHFLQYGLPLLGRRVYDGCRRLGSCCHYREECQEQTARPGDLQFEHFNLSHSRRQTNTALKLAPKTGATERKTGGAWSLNRQSFIQFSFSFLSPNWKVLKMWSLK